MLGALFLSQLRQKVHRGLTAAVLAGRFAGGRAYGYRKVIGFDDRGRPLTGLLEIADIEAKHVIQIFRWFSCGLSAIQIAKRLNLEKIPGPRGGEWNASTIRGDPKKLVGILNNPLYRGELVWNRREWRKNPDSDRRERLYRLRNQEDWIRMELPDLRIVDDALWDSVQQELKRRAIKQQDGNPTRQRRRRHLLSGLIKCATCGSNYTISGKDYYRCAGVKERGTCDNTVTVRLAHIEQATMSVLQHRLLTERHARIFVEEFRAEVARLAREHGDISAETEQKLKMVEKELANLEQNMLSGVLSPTLQRLLSEREAEKARLEALLSSKPQTTSAPDILPHSVLLQGFEEKVRGLREALNDEAIRTEAAAIIASLIESVTIYPQGSQGPEAEVTARIDVLMDYAQSDSKVSAYPLDKSSIPVVAGAGFEPATFRL